MTMGKEPRTSGLEVQTACVDDKPAWMK